MQSVDTVVIGTGNICSGASKNGILSELVRKTGYDITHENPYDIFFLTTELNRGKGLTKTLNIDISQFGENGMWRSHDPKMEIKDYWHSEGYGLENPFSPNVVSDAAEIFERYVSGSEKTLLMIGYDGSKINLENVKYTWDLGLRLLRETAEVSERMAEGTADLKLLMNYLESNV